MGAIPQPLSGRQMKVPLHPPLATRPTGRPPRVPYQPTLPPPPRAERRSRSARTVCPGTDSRVLTSGLKTFRPISRRLRYMLSRRKNSLASTLRPFGIEITRGKRGSGSRHIKISARPESARRIAPNAPNAAAAAENAMIDCATTRPIAPSESKGGCGRGRNGRNSTASFREADESAPPSATSNATDRQAAESAVPTDAPAAAAGRTAITKREDSLSWNGLQSLDEWAENLPTDF